MKNIAGSSCRTLTFFFEPVGVTDGYKKRGRITKTIIDVTEARLDLMIGTSRPVALEKDDSDDDDVFVYEKDQPAGAIVKFVANKYLEVYGTDNRRVS